MNNETRSLVVLQGIIDGKQLKQIAEEQDVSKQYVNELVTMLVLRKYLKKITRGTYKATKAGLGQLVDHVSD